jgi:RNA polymerase sigma factor (sigma-70 family)
MKIQLKPWTDERGRLLSDDDLRFQSKGWNTEIWEAYLKTIEVKNSGMKYKPEIYDAFCSELMASIFSVVTNEKNSILKNKIEDAIADLPEKQRDVLHLIFWEGKSQRKIAKSWGVQQSSVFDLKERALSNLRISLENLQGAVTSGFMNGDEKSSSFKSQSIQSDIAEVMSAEINRNATQEAYWRKNL